MESAWGHEPWYQKATGMIEAVIERENMLAAYQRVMSNKGAAGVDGMSVGELQKYLQEHWSKLRGELVAGTYKPKAVRSVAIPKTGGGVRKLGIPTVVDRLIQQALLQILSPLFEVEFSEHSYGYRPGRSAHQAIQQARQYVASGNSWVVDIDLENFFDEVNHDMLMSRIRRKVSDKRVLKLLWRYLQSGILQQGVVQTRQQGTPQGSPLSPLLSNILLDDLDRELQRRGHQFCRYADDCNIYVQSEQAGLRVKDSISRWLWKKLRLRLNEAKSAVDRPWRRKFLGYRVSAGRQTRLKVSPESVQKLKTSIRQRLQRSASLVQLIEGLRPRLRGWLNYFRHAEVSGVFEQLDNWIRRRLRLKLWRQWKRPHTRRKMLMRYGLNQQRASVSAYNGRGPWWNSGASHMNQALPKRFFQQLGLFSLLDHYRLFQPS